MKKHLALFLLLFLTGCSEDEKKTGSCTGCCAPDGTTICYNNISEEECKNYDKSKLDSMNWSFVESKLPCFTTTPKPGGN